MARVMWRRDAAVVLVSLGVCGTSMAAEQSGAYVVANYGRSPSFFRRADVDDAVVAAFNQTLAIESASIARHGTRWSAGVGYRLGQNFAIEASYLNLAQLR